MPLFERTERPSAEIDLGLCANHPNVPAQGECGRCKKKICLVCRSRWHDETICPECIRVSLEKRELHPRDLQTDLVRSQRGFALAVLGWFIFLSAWAILLRQTGPPPIRWSVSLTLVALIPALFALGIGVVQVMFRQGAPRLGLSTMMMSSVQVGLTLGLLVVNLLRN